MLQWSLFKIFDSSLSFKNDAGWIWNNIRALPEHRQVEFVAEMTKSCRTCRQRGQAKGVKSVHGPAVMCPSLPIDGADKHL